MKNTLIGLALLLTGLFAGAMLVRQNQNINEGAAPASSIYFSPNTQNVGQNNNFNFNIKIDSTENLISGVDIRIKFDKDIFEIVSLEKGQSISDFNNLITSETGNNTGEIKYIAFTLDKSKAINGSNLDILKVNAKVKGDAPKATYTIEFADQTAASGLLETQNIITGSDSTSITITDHTNSDSTYVEGEPNSCGGTCGSNNNCKANLYCYQGFCRNPICSTETDCDCAIQKTATATAKPSSASVGLSKGATIKPVSSSSPKPTPTYTAGMALIDKPTELERDDSEETAESPINMFFTKYAMYLLGGFILIIIVSIIYATKKRRSINLPHIVPPTNI